mmetsp:Transcript_16394/g.49344  ORF Transcript_16394/g.49344 Transcript_16394/m.49344 type:complete len:245 (+) Transcript_16394:335-1069(+)
MRSHGSSCSAGQAGGRRSHRCHQNPQRRWPQGVPPCHSGGGCWRASGSCEASLRQRWRCASAPRPGRRGRVRSCSAESPNRGSRRMASRCRPGRRRRPPTGPWRCSRSSCTGGRGASPPRPAGGRRCGRSSTAGPTETIRRASAQRPGRAPSARCGRGRRGPRSSPAPRREARPTASPPPWPSRREAARPAAPPAPWRAQGQAEELWLPEGGRSAAGSSAPAAGAAAAPEKGVRQHAPPWFWRT